MTIGLTKTTVTMIEAQVGDPRMNVLGGTVGVALITTATLSDENHVEDKAEGRAGGNTVEVPTMRTNPPTTDCRSARGRGRLHRQGDREGSGPEVKRCIGMVVLMVMNRQMPLTHSVCCKVRSNFRNSLECIGQTHSLLCFYS